MDLTIDLSSVQIETDRLILRTWRMEDLEDFFEYASVEGVGERAGWRHHASIEESREILKRFIDEKTVFAIILKENAKAIGSLGIHDSWASDDESYAHLTVKEIGYVLSKDYWGKGLMTEAVKAVLPFCFEELKLDALTVGHFVENAQSRRVIEKCGFTFVKNSTYYSKQLDQTIDDMKYIVLRQS